MKSTAIAIIHQTHLKINTQGGREGERQRVRFFSHNILPLREFYGACDYLHNRGITNSVIRYAVTGVSTPMT